jgi:hypothetical protein
MEKNWNQKLLLGCINYGTAVEKEKGQKKINETLKEWEDLSRDAIIVSQNLSFLEVLGWLKNVAPKMKSDYFNALKKIATNNQEKTVMAILSQDIDFTNKIDLSILIETTNIYQGIISTDTTIWLINERPDILTEIKTDILRNVANRSFSLKFFQNEKCHLLLNCFHNSKDIYNFSEKTKGIKNFHGLFINNELIIKAWDKLSDDQLSQAKNFDEASTVFHVSSESWQKNLQNFKNILKLMNYNENNINFLHQIKDSLGEDSIHLKALVMVYEKNIENELLSGNTSWKNLYNEASWLEIKITPLERKIIQKYLES